MPHLKPKFSSSIVEELVRDRMLVVWVGSRRTWTGHSFAMCTYLNVYTAPLQHTCTNTISGFLRGTWVGRRHLTKWHKWESKRMAPDTWKVFRWKWLLKVPFLNCFYFLFIIYFYFWFSSKKFAFVTCTQISFVNCGRDGQSRQLPSSYVNGCWNKISSKCAASSKSTLESSKYSSGGKYLHHT